MSFLVNSFNVPNALVDELLRELSPNALKCYMLIVRKTTGWGKSKDKISNSQITQFTGIKDERTIKKACDELSRFGLIVVNKTC